MVPTLVPVRDARRREGTAFSGDGRSQASVRMGGSGSLRDPHVPAAGEVDRASQRRWRLRQFTDQH